ncbi:MAG: hypothetical protein H6Q23_857, partial [Bacteroidetes bacterium]|nr:hypothetical protein [Bacteroidota bacterium]
MEFKILEAPTIEFNTSTCSKCGLCTKVCPTKVFKTTNGDDKVTGDDNMKMIRDITAEYIQKTIRLLNSWYLKAMANFSELAKAGIGVVPDLQMRIDQYRNKNDLIIYNAPAAIFFHAPKYSSTPQTDCDNALQVIQLYAESFGLATCWNGLIQGAASGDHLKGFTKLA